MRRPFSVLLPQYLAPLLYAGLYHMFNVGLVLEFSLGVALLGLGMYLGVALSWLDEHVFYSYYRSDSPEQNQWPQLATRSLLFVLTLIPLGIFIVSSTGSELGVGVLLGFAIVILSEMNWLHRFVDEFHAHFLWQLKRRLNEQEIRQIFLAFGLATLIFSGLVVV